MHKHSQAVLLWETSLTAFLSIKNSLHSRNVKTCANASKKGKGLKGNCLAKAVHRVRMVEVVPAHLHLVIARVEVHVRHITAGIARTCAERQSFWIQMFL